MINPLMTIFWLVSIGISLILLATSDGLIGYVTESFASVIGFGSTIIYFAYVILIYTHKRNKKLFKILFGLILLTFWGLYFYFYL